MHTDTYPPYIHVCFTIHLHCIYVIHVRIENLHIFCIKKFTEIEILPQWVWGMIYPTVSTSFFTHLNSLSHSSLPAEPSKNSTEGWNEFFHFSGECSAGGRQGGRQGGRRCPGLPLQLHSPGLPGYFGGGSCSGCASPARDITARNKGKELQTCKHKKPTPWWHPDELHYRVPFILLWLQVKLY